MASTAHRPVFAISVSLTATLSILLVGQLMSQSTSASKNTKAPTGNATQTPPVTAEEKEAQFHYKVAVTALKNNDLEIADSELEKAAKLAPNNALVQYNLAVVKSKSQKPAGALVNLKKAIELGLPSPEAAQADDLLVQLTYKAQKSQSGRFSWLIGRWVVNFEGFILFPPIKVRVGTYRSCVYQMDVTSILTVSSDSSDADSLEGKLSYHAQGNGNVKTSSYDDKYADDCLSAFGPPQQISVDSTYKSSKIEPFVRWDVLASAVEQDKVRDQIVISLLNEKCTGYCANWEWGGNPNLVFNLDRQFDAIELFRIDDSHVGHSGNFVRQDVTLFGPANVQLVKQD